MNKNNKILVTGANGFLGKHLVHNLKKNGYTNIISVSSRDYNLTLLEDQEKLFSSIKPEIVFSLAAKVGGIFDNKSFPADFYYQNILIGAYTYEMCKKYRVKKLISIGAGCGYPLELTEPLREEHIWDGFPQPDSAPYSIAKKMLILQNIAYKKQYELDSIVLIPSNLYGEYDNFNLEKSHVIPALVRKFYEAKLNNFNSIEVWGDGSAKRDFIHAHDVSTAVIKASETYSSTLPLNICFGQQSSIKEVVDILAKISGFTGNINWNLSKPSGQSSRLMSLENRNKYLSDWKPEFNLEKGLLQTYTWFEKNYNSNIRL